MNYNRCLKCPVFCSTPSLALFLIFKTDFIIKLSVKHKKIIHNTKFLKNPRFLNKTKSMASCSQGEKCNGIVIHEWDGPNMGLLRPY